jgi:gliding motility-associated-like protein
MELVSDSGCVSVLEHPGSVEVFETPVASFKINPDEVDEDEPTINVTSYAGNGITETRYFINDGATFTTPDFVYNLKNIDGNSRPLIVQIVRNEAGCSDTAFDIIKIKPAFSIYIPDAFTPNGDGINDEFFAKGVGIVEFTMQIYDRWGHVVFVANELTHKWDGRSKNSSEPIKQDVYNWKAKVVDVHNKSHEMAGHVTLVQ